MDSPAGPPPMIHTSHVETVILDLPRPGLLCLPLAAGRPFDPFTPACGACYLIALQHTASEKGISLSNTACLAVSSKGGL